MNSIYILEFTVTMLLVFVITLFGKGYAHLYLGILLLLTGTLFTVNCFNPALALCSLLANTININQFIYFLGLEISGAVTGFILGTYFTNMIWST